MNIKTFLSVLNINNDENHSWNRKSHSSPLKCLNQDPWYAVASFYFGDNNNNNTTKRSCTQCLIDVWTTMNHSILFMVYAKSYPSTICFVRYQFNVRDLLHVYNDLVLWQKHICITRIEISLKHLSYCCRNV